MSLLDRITSKAKDLDRETWIELDSHCLACGELMELGHGACWTEDNRLLICGECAIELCNELLKELEAENHKLREALERYGKHDLNCVLKVIRADPGCGSCTCGWTETEKELI